MDNTKVISDIIEIIKNNNTFFIGSHQRPDGDAIGASLALFSLLNRLNKKALIANVDSPNKNYAFLPGIENFKDVRKINNSFDVAFILECADLSRLGNMLNIRDHTKIIVNIDHHEDSELFGNINYIDPKASSNAEQIYNIFKAIPLELTKDEAVYIYVGILTDTNRFSGINTSPLAHKIAAELIAIGIDPSEITRKIYEEKELTHVRLLGTVLRTLEVIPEKHISYVTITKKIFDESGAKEGEIDEFVNFARSLKDIKVAILFKETNNPGEVKVSFRSNGDIDVLKVAKIFSGGGHKRASGCLVKGSLEEVKEKILNEVFKVS